MDIQEFVIKRLKETSGFLVRDTFEDLPFWYTSNHPGPYFINTQNIIGYPKVDEILHNINIILESNYSLEIKSTKIWDLISHQLNEDLDYLKLVNNLVDFVEKNNVFHFDLMSGGERRDWFFSIPLAIKLKMNYVFLFKDGSTIQFDSSGHLVEENSMGKKVLHVADIINLASSYEKRWIPTLCKNNISINNTLTIAVRNKEGIKTLSKHNISVISPLYIDIELFKKSFELGLISEFAFEDIKFYYDSPYNWTKELICKIGDKIIYKLKDLNDIQISRIKNFIEQDQYHLENEFVEFFKKIKNEFSYLEKHRQKTT